MQFPVAVELATDELRDDFELLLDDLTLLAIELIADDFELLAEDLDLLATELLDDLTLLEDAPTIP